MSPPLLHPESQQAAPLSLSGAEFAERYPRESDTVEFKAGVSGRAVQDAVCAFSNTDGGVLLIGVSDEGGILGKELTQNVEETLHQAVSTLRNPGQYFIHRVVVGDKPITALAVARRVEGFAQTSEGRILVRRGPRNEPLFDADLLRFISTRTLERFELRDAEVALRDADEALLAEVAEAYDWHESQIEDRLREQHLLTPASGEPKLTIAGALYLLEKPNAVIGKALIEVFRFPADAAEYDKRMAVEGPLHSQVRRATEIVLDELGTELVVLGLERHDLPRLPEVVLREAIANAVAHRSYEMSRSAIRIEIRPDAVTIISPGPLPVPVTIENIREAQAARNIAVINVLRRLRLAEDAGRGVDVMQDSMKAELLEPPVFRDTGHAVEVTLPVRSAVTGRERAWVRELERRGQIEPPDRILLVHAARGDVLSNKRARELLSVDRIDATRALQRLRKAGFLVQRGERGGATYVLRGDLAPPAGLRLSPDALAAAVLDMAREGPLTNATVRGRFGLDRLDVLAIFNELVAQGRLFRLGTRRSSRYVLPEHRER